MTHTNLTAFRLLSLSALLACTLPLHAADPIQARWSEVCRAAGSDQLTITTANGDTVNGYCTSVDANDMSVTTLDKRVVKIARTALSRIDKHSTSNDGRQLRSLGRSIGHGFGVLLSPWAPVGLFVVPPLLAWGAVAAPFCVIGDLIHQEAGTQEIKII